MKEHSHLWEEDILDRVSLQPSSEEGEGLQETVDQVPVVPECFRLLHDEVHRGGLKKASDQTAIVLTLH